MHDQNTAPHSYMKNSQGHLVPVELINDIDRERDALVQDVIIKAKALQTALGQFKAAAMGDMQAFIELSAEKYGVKMGGKKGNVSLTSYDGRYKLQRAISEYIVFDERLQIAKELIDQCINEWAQGARAEIRVLINDAFQVDKEGKVSTWRILGLKRLDINDPKWQQAMQAITDSMQVAGSSIYLRLYERAGETERYEQIPLDIAAL